MTSFIIPWAFVMSYHHHQQTMTIQCSKTLKHALELKHDNFQLKHQDILEFVHKYDLRKLDYFTKVDLQETFDTLIRFRFSPIGLYMRTIAVCQRNANGFSCIHVMEEDMLKVRHRVASLTIHQTSVKLEILDGDWIQSMHLSQQLPQIKHHFKEIIHRL